MNLLNKNNQNQTKDSNSILSASKPQNTILNINSKQEIQFQTKLKQKKVIKIYIEENKYYIEHSTAYALGLIKTRAIMLDKPKMIEIPDSIHNKLKNQDDINIEYIKIEKKQALKVFVDDSNCYIDNAAAYALGLISTEEFYSLDNEYYYISKELFDNLKAKFEIEFHSLNLEEEIHKKR